MDAGHDHLYEGDAGSPPGPIIEVACGPYDAHAGTANPRLPAGALALTLAGSEPGSAVNVDG